MKDITPIRKDLVLVGGGHSHAIALRMFGMKPLPGVRITLISDGSDTPYSGMLPGHVAGFYQREECHINLRSLCQFDNVQFVLDRAIGLDLANQRVICETHPDIAFDVVSFDIGSTPKLPQELDDHSVAAKPVSVFLEWWNQFCDRVVPGVQIGIIGGGTGGVELAVNIHHRLREILQSDDFTIHAFQRDRELLPKHNARVRRYFTKLLTQKGIQLHLDETVLDRKVTCESGLIVPCNETVWVTQATAPSWIARSGLQTDANGFILVDDSLRSISHSNVFAAGDIATMQNFDRPKAGVFAVRQGKPLFQNLRHTLLGEALERYQPQRHYLSLIGTGNGAAVASYGAIALQSRWLWTLKDHIDRSFMQRFADLPQMEEPALLEDPSMRCLGCGAKVGKTTLERVLNRISVNPKNKDILIGLNNPDDAAVIQVPIGKVMVQTIDYFPALLSDPFLFGQISTNHSLSDLFAMGATPQSALAIATLPYATEAKQEETLYQLLSGAMKTLHNAQAELIGGHTVEGERLAFGLTCNGVADRDRLLQKNGLQPGQVLILTKPLGTGMLFAAEMRRETKAQWIDDAIAIMLRSNQNAATCFLKHHATACTDITGFGLVGHLLEMVQASQVSVKLHLDAIPKLRGTQHCIDRHLLSSLHPQNLSASRWIANLEKVSQYPEFPILFDPQTSGGLLASVSAEQARSCLAELRSMGNVESAIVGEVFPLEKDVQPIAIVP